MLNNVREKRRQLNMTQMQLAEKVDVTRQTISLIEKGEYNPSLKLCITICKSMNQTLDQLFWLEEE